MFTKNSFRWRGQYLNWFVNLVCVFPLCVVSLSLQPQDYITREQQSFIPLWKSCPSAQQAENLTLHYTQFPKGYITREQSFIPLEKLSICATGRKFNPSLNKVSLSLAPGLHHKRTAEFHPPLEKLSICSTGRKFNPSLHIVSQGLHHKRTEFHPSGKVVHLCNRQKI